MGSVPVHTISPRFGLTPGNFHAAAPALGEHTREALRSAGYSDEKIAELERAGAVKTGVVQR
jgi:crotonobetainyl-CoA:carnitine CoA-transferase CaiB-like acyl-CoA transferase